MRAPVTLATRPVGPGRALDPEDGPRPYEMALLDIPLNGLPDSLLAQLDELGPRFTGWGRWGSGCDADQLFFVDVGERFSAPSLRGAIKKARAAQRRTS